MTPEVLARLRIMDGRASFLSVRSMSSPRCLASCAASLSSGGIRACIDVISLAWREKAS